MAKSIPYKIGELAGDIGSFAFGAAEAGTGAGGELLGFTADGTVVLAPAGVALNAASLGLVTHRGAATIKSAHNFSEDLFSLIKGEGNKGPGKAPDYIKDNRVPLDKETVLSSKDYKKTNIKVKGAQVYKNGDNYYYRDTFHTGEASHLEVFDKRGNHIGEANPQTGELIPETVDSTKKINVK
ncbi:hypothetical protein [Clostridium kluyveri]|uniref:hypothetical protein n=1 Tax=Clostridium kluyveri TaxID=1534 RepID=UPI000AC70DAE|nr:hypothetical protein [Clostridium kluyveri]